ncbi:hypothetical protein [Algoriphagus terrigena]|uniref:hypothetical protein n=1 Tax=Algoriphagus terrigena TaxID=344884 RepID=UPI0003FF0666|nr:hypothetical protein [Algoriphagus terrigena]
MFPLVNRWLFIYLAMNFYLCQNFQAFAQRPPTGGAAPIAEEDESINPAVFIVGGVVIGAASYLLFKSRSPKIPVANHLTDYLRSNQIMPNPDALELMYAINPSLNNIEEIRTNKKLNLPSFPEFDQDQAGDLLIEDASDLPTDLRAQMNQFESSKASFEQMNSQKTNLAGDSNMAKIRTIIQEVETDLNSIGMPNEITNPVTGLLISDLVFAFNRTLQEIISVGKADPAQVGLMQGIADNLTELLAAKTLTSGKERDKMLALTNQELKPILSAYLGPTPDSKDLSSGLPPAFPVETMAMANTMNFAFAVYMYSKEGELITEGPKVQGRFIVRYVAPALKDFENAYHTIRTPATYAVAAFPPAKMYFVVEDLNGNRMNVQYPTIDFREEFSKPQFYNEDKVIVVPLRINQ